MKQSIVYKEIAKYCGVTERYVRMIDKKERNPSMEIAKKISDFLGEPIEDIFFNIKPNVKFVFERFYSKLKEDNRKEF
ncbi:helix-turn-helix transcriptional regulator [Bacillus cereus]|uniref:helix-turn-helix transcriptional regulator n=1 Tax=Bacillus cereus TaxID=1396 RepID=UPI000BF80542|nr:helix-turn-helix transcriptional regulator [Bacillus cereus]PEQ61127.1 transcriptional regulator [Bacillus cereus]